MGAVLSCDIQCIFEPRVIEFDRKRIGLLPSSHPDVLEEIMEHAADHVVSLSA
jgi:actin-related protein 8